MDQTRYASRLRYIDADDIDDSYIDFDGLDVRGTDGEKLGDVDGFLIDPTSNRVLYTVVDSGGWFTSRRFLLPIGHAQVDRDARALRVEVTRDTLRTYPEFDENRFQEFSDDDFTAYESRMAAVCCPDDIAPATGHVADTRRHYAQPQWWKAGAYSPDRLRPVEARTFADRSTAVRQTRGVGGDVSPHVDGRAQPGDVLGIETGGERTSIGDTAEDEDKGRRDAEGAVGNDSDRKR